MKYQANSSCVIMSLILMTTLKFDAAITLRVNQALRTLPYYCSDNVQSWRKVQHAQFQMTRFKGAMFFYLLQPL